MQFFEVSVFYRLDLKKCGRSSVWEALLGRFGADFAEKSGVQKRAEKEQILKWVPRWVGCGRMRDFGAARRNARGQPGGLGGAEI